MSVVRPQRVDAGAEAPAFVAPVTLTPPALAVSRAGPGLVRLEMALGPMFRLDVILTDDAAAQVGRELSAPRVAIPTPHLH